MRIKRFEDVIAWQRAKLLTIEVQKTFKNTPNFSFKDQVFRASLSIMNNIAEGFDRGTDKELKYFLIISRGSTAEVRSMLIVASELNYLPTDEHQHLLGLTEEISKLLSGFINKLENTKNYRLVTSD